MSCLDLDRREPPPSYSLALQALWWDAKGSWQVAHRIVADEGGADAAWVHAYLHRKEGDVGNAAYWYARARRPSATGPLDCEWESITAALMLTA